MFKALVAFPVVLALAFSIARNPNSLLALPGGLLTLVFWIIVVATVDLLPVELSTGLRLSLSFPIVLGVALLYPSPLAAAFVAFVGSFDLRELRRETSLLSALFNRSQLALSIWAGSSLFHSIASIHSRWPSLVPGVLAAIAATYLVNVVLVASYMRLARRLPLTAILSGLLVGAIPEFLFSYLGLGFVGLVIALLYRAVGFWSVAVFILPLVFARQMFFRTMALEEAHKELKQRERVLRALSNRMAEERQDERMQIAGYLHDDLAQMLFRLTLQAEMAKKRLSRGDFAAVDQDLDRILDTKQQTSDAVRALIKDLHRSPIGRRGLAEAIQSFADDISQGHPTTITTDVVEVALPPPIQLLIYQIAREAAMNALKHAEADHIRISLTEAEDGVQLQIRDDGKGFDTAAPPPEGHFGSVMMRERALVAGGTYSVTSEPGKGTMIAATFPSVWVEEGTALEAAAAEAESETGPSSLDGDAAASADRAPEFGDPGLSGRNGQVQPPTDEQSTPVAGRAGLTAGGGSGSEGRPDDQPGAPAARPPIPA